jgi:ABC-type transport system substrate-binding protein
MASSIRGEPLHLSFTPGVELVMDAFDEYWRKAPSVERIVFKVIPDEATRFAALKRGEIDIAYSILGELADELQKTPGLTLKSASPRLAVAVFLRPVGPEIAVARQSGET